MASSAPANDEDVVGLDRFVERGDLAAQQRVAGRLRVAEREPSQSARVSSSARARSVGHRLALDVRRAEEVLDRELPAGEVALEREVGDAHPGHDAAPCRRMSSTRSSSSACPRRSVATSPGWSRRPAELRELGLVERRPGPAGPGRCRGARRRRPADRAGLRARPGPAGEEPGADLRVPAARAGHGRVGGRRRRRRAPGCSSSVATAPRTPARWRDCGPHDPGRRLAIAWFDAHGDFNTPDTTPSGNVWGMPFAMLCGRGDPDLVTRCRRPDRHGAGCGAVRRPGARRGRNRGRSRRRGSPTSAPGCWGPLPASPRSTAWAGDGRRARRRDLRRLRHGLPRCRAEAGR